MKKITQILILFPLWGLGGFAQTFQWAHSMGSCSANPEPSDHEQALGIDKDEAGNTYILASVFNGLYEVYHDSLLVDGGRDGGFYPNPESFPSERRFANLLSSYDLKGNLRWKKYIISPSGYGKGFLKILKDGIYISVSLCTHYWNDCIIIDRDTILHQNKNDMLDWEKGTIFFMKWDTLGNFQWFKQPGNTYINPSISEEAEVTFPLSMEADGHGNIVCLYKYGKNVSDLPKPYVVIRFDSNWNVLSKNPLDIENLRHGTELFTYSNGKYYMIGENQHIGNEVDSVIVGHDTIKYDTAWGGGCRFSVLASFNSDGSARWGKVFMKNALPTSNILVDSAGYFYIAGGMRNYNPNIGGELYCFGIIDEDTIFFPDDIFYGSAAYIGKYDSLGKRVWFNYSIPESWVFNPPLVVRGGESGIGNICFMPGNRIAATGTSSTNAVYFDSIYLYEANEQNEYAYRQNLIATIDPNTGKFLTADYVGRFSKTANEGEVERNGTTNVFSDKFGNLYVAGILGDTYYMDSITLVNKRYTSAQTEDVFFAKYGYPLGEYAPYLKDSLSVGEINTPKKVEVFVYPNPAKEVLLIANQEAYILQGELYDMVGKKVRSCTVPAIATYSLPLNNLQSGVYMLKLQGKGNSKTVKVVVR